MSKMFEKFRQYRKAIIFILVAVILFVIDIVTKNLAYTYLKGQGSVEIKGFSWLVRLTYCENTGAAWGMGGDNKFSQILLCLLSYAAAIFLIYYIVKNKLKNTLLNTSLFIILAGDVGNLIDRTFALLPFNTIYQNGVIDFIDITPLIPNFGIFNFADSCICVGVAILLVYEIKTLIKNKDKNNEQNNSEQQGN